MRPPTFSAIRPTQLLLLALVVSVGLLDPADAQCTGTPVNPVNGVFPASCSGSAPGSTCTAKCNTGYTSVPAPISTCVGNTWSAPSGSCNKVCIGLPSAAILGATGSWPSTCNSTVPVSGQCIGVCASGYFGNPTATCISGNWSASTVVGRCVNGPVCTGVPTATVVNALPFPASCADTPVAQGGCSTVCKSGYGGSTAPTVTCVPDANSPTGGSWGPTTGACNQVCSGLPTASVSGGGTWPASCNNLGLNQACNATCPANTDGTPSVQCLSTGWSTSVSGRCSSTAKGQVCKSLPPGLANGVWSPSCKDTPAGGQCWAMCNNNQYFTYFKDGTPMATCNPDGTWSVGPITQCRQGAPVPNIGKVFLFGYGIFAICDLSGNVTSNCIASNGLTDTSPALNGGQNSGYATDDTVWVTSYQSLNVHVCKYNSTTNVVTSCKVQTLPPTTLNYAVGLVIDARTNTAFVARPLDCLMACPNATDLSTCQCVVPSTPKIPDPTVMIYAGRLWFTSFNFGAVVRCDINGSAVQNCVSFDGFANPRGLAIDGSKGLLYLTAGSGTSNIKRCDATTMDPASCITAAPFNLSDYYGLFTIALSPTSTNLFVPVLYNTALVTCLNPATDLTSSGCTTTPAPFSPAAVFVLPTQK